MNLVEVYHNPYRIFTRIMINGKPISDFSSLSRYSREPFLQWCSEICDQIARELNGEYELIFYSGEYEAEIMENLRKKCSFCKGYRSSATPISLPMAKRLSYLSRFIKKSGIQDFCRSDIQVNCVLYPSCKRFEGLIHELEIQNVFCKTFFQVEESGRNTIGHDGILLVLANETEYEKAFFQFASVSEVGFLLRSGYRHRFLEKRGNVLAYEFDKNNPEQTIFTAMLLEPLRKAFCDCKKSLVPEMAEKPECRTLDAMEPEMEAEPFFSVEAGYEKELKYAIYPQGATLSLEFIAEDEKIAICRDSIVCGIKGGETQVNIYNQITKELLAEVSVQVYETNHIQSILIEKQRILLPVGGSTRLKYQFLPENADNISQLHWNSQNNTVAAVDETGMIRGISYGRSKVTLTAGKAYAECTVSVKEKLRKLEMEKSCLTLTKGEWEPLSFIAEPPDYYPESVYAYIEDKTIVSYENGILYAEQAGETNLVFYNEQRDVECKCHIIVTEKSSMQTEKHREHKRGIIQNLWNTLISGKE